MNNEKNIKDVISYLPFSLKNIFSSDNVPDNLQEIHLISDKPLMLYTNNTRFFINEYFKLTKEFSGNLIKVSKSELEETFQRICNYSVYSRQSEINNGFITLSGGNRAGICGTAVKNTASINNIRDISSINIRLAREIKDCSISLCENVNDLKSSILICGAPCSGKTTVLRDLARRLSYTYKVSLIDTRLELASCRNGIAQFDVGLCDVFSSYEKKDGFEQALRCMAPEYIICDEISSEDIEPLYKAKNSGVKIIASLHCSDKKDLLSESNISLLKNDIFSEFVFLKDRENAGQVSEIVNKESFYD